MRRLIPTLIAFFVFTSPAQAAWLWPVPGEVITPYRNGSDPYATGQHRGIDIAAPVGTPVRAASAGEVRFAGTAGSSGVTISIRTSDGYDTSYLHLSALDVRAGAHVSAGERIGAVGTTGTRSAAAPHVHFGVRDAGTRHAYHDPLTFLPPAPPAGPAPEPPSPVPAPRPEPSPPPPTPAPLPVGAPRTTRAPDPHGPRAPRAAPRPVGAIRLPTVEEPLRQPHRSDTVSAASPGPDIGWLLACAGLLLAAAVLGLSEDGRRATGRTRSKLIAALPAFGRR